MSTPVKTLPFPQRQIVPIAPGEFSIQQLTMIREAILCVVDEGNRDGLVWMLDTEDEDRANQDRLDFCDAVQSYLVDRTVKL